MEATVIYEDLKDKELLENINSKVPLFLSFINFNKEKKIAFKIKSHWGAIKNPFVEVKDKDKTIKVFYSDSKGDNAIYQLINYLNDCKN